PEHPHVATVYAIASSKAHDQIWYEEAEAGTLADVLEKRGKISAEEVAKIAAGLAQGLNWLHEQQMVFEEFSAERVLFTLNGEIKLLAPTKDLRGSTAAVLHDGIEQDTGAVAKLIWRCLTGEVPGALYHRAPLKLLIPDSHPELGATLERAIDREKPQPTLTEISALITHHYSPAEVDLFASAHPSVRSYIPAIEVPTQSQHGSKSRFGRRKSAKSVAISAQKKQSSWLYPAAIAAALCAISATVFLVGQNSESENVPVAVQTSSNPTMTTPAASSSSASAGATSSSLPAQ
ncbi:MAG: protein kinase, partial [Rothia sp. (in: high G+C Gram-positive bacteria)]|nr:protein kinase [Rothia sp. (in: high G+C Gram-positive bacteria)]